MADEFGDCDDGDDGEDETWKPYNFHFVYTQRQAEAKVEVVYIVGFLCEV